MALCEVGKISLRPFESKGHESFGIKFHEMFTVDDLAKTKNGRRCHAEPVSASNQFKNLKDPETIHETSSGQG